MTVYLIGEVKVTDPAWIPDYAEKVHDIAAQHGGKYLSRSGKIDTVEGAPSMLRSWPWSNFPTARRSMPSQAIPPTRPSPKHAKQAAKAGCT